MKKCIVFAPIAQREIDFYLEFAEHAKENSWPFKVEFISFFQSGNQLLKSRGYKVYDIYEWIARESEFKVNINEFEKYYNVDNLHKLILHEKLTFGIEKNKELYTKFFKYLNGLNLILCDLKKTFSFTDIIVFQELGGFIAPLSLMYNCKKESIQHVFFEPSFFKGTMNFIENSFISSFKGLSSITLPADDEAVKYLQAVKNSKSLVIPQKDKHHYKDMGLEKLFNLSNFKKLYNKLYLKYFKKQKQEYEQIFNHVFRGIRQYINRKKTGALYSKDIPEHEFIYFPFHVQLDVQLTIRNPEFLDQLAFVEFVAQVLPKRYKLVIKEHPASIGGFDPLELKRILRNNENIKLMYPMINTYEILDKASAVITINSKVGAEALSLGKLVACMGHGFYWNSEIADKFSSNVELLKWLEDVSLNKISPRNQAEIELYFSEIYRQSHKFELYNHSKENLHNFFEAIHKHVQK